MSSSVVQPLTPKKRPGVVSAASALLYLCAAVLLLGVVIGLGLLGVLLAIGFAVLGFLVGRGQQMARIATWCVAGLGVLCLGGGRLVRAVNPPRGIEVKEIPAWAWAVGYAVDFISLLALVMVAALLALPAASAFFRRPEAPWVPPTT